MMTKAVDGRKAFFKYFLIAVVVQTIGSLACGLVAMALPALQSVLVGVFYFYAPTIALIWIVLGLKGGAALVYPIILGIPLGILVYSFIFALLRTYLFKRRLHRRANVHEAS